jgi:beta-glucosidase
MVLNEPAGFTTLGYWAGVHAPDRTGIGKFLSTVHHTSLCQAEGGRIIRRNVNNSHIGTTFSCSHIEPYKLTERYQKSAKRLDVVLNRLFIEPSLGMGYPYEDLPLLKKIEKYIQPGDMDKLPFDFDFIGLQNYFRVVTKPSIIPYIWANRVKPDTNAELTEMGWEVAPEGMYRILKQFSKYPVKEIIITENGAAFPDQLENGRVHDPQRIKFYKEYLHNILKAKREGVNVKGYFAWTFIDNFEWAEGLRPRFGLVYNDFETQKRTIKDSGYWFRDFLKTED